MVAQLTGIKVPGIPVRVCPNCTGRGRKVPFTAEELAGSYYDRHPRKGRSGHADSDEDIPPDHDDPIEEDGFQVSNDFDASVSTSGSLFLETSRKPDGNSTGAPR